MNNKEEQFYLKKDIILSNMKQDNNTYLTKPIIIVKVSKDAMEATLLLHPSSLNTLPPLKQDILDTLTEHHITTGLNMPLIDDLCIKPVYYHVFVIARGIPAGVGKDGYINYLVTMPTDRRPKINEDGTADYKNIDYFKVVHEGQPLCEIIHPEKGTDGIDVHGNILDGKFGKNPINPTGVNTCLNNDKTFLLASKDGHIKILYGIVSVTEVLEIDCVNNSTGNIDFIGDVIIKGDVASGFSINAGGSVVIYGNIEGANIQAGSDINVSSGMFGMDIGSIHANGDIRCKFIQNCNVKATGNIYAESILFSNIGCDGDMEITGKKGALIGGKVTVGGKIIAKTIGTSMHVPTEVNIIFHNAEKNEYINNLHKQIATLNEEIHKIIQELTKYENQKKILQKIEIGNTKNLLSITEAYTHLVKKRDEAEKQYVEITKNSFKSIQENCYIEIKDNIYPNTKIHILNSKLVIEHSLNKIRIQLTDEGIAVVKL